MSYDYRCFDLAQVFIDDEPRLQRPGAVAELAQKIQTAIEEWLEEQKGRT